jgi:hypothetical protein
MSFALSQSRSNRAKAGTTSDSSISMIKAAKSPPQQRRPSPHSHHIGTAVHFLSFRTPHDASDIWQTGATQAERSEVSLRNDVLKAWRRWRGAFPLTQLQPLSEGAHHPLHLSGTTTTTASIPSLTVSPLPPTRRRATENLPPPWQIKLQPLSWTSECHLPPTADSYAIEPN